jgi:hypothetical protein
MGVLKRTGDAFIDTFDNIKNLVIAPSIDTLGDATFGTMDSFFSITSTWANARKIWYAEHVGGIPDNRGRIILSNANLDNAGVNIQSMMMKGMGIKLNVEKAYWDQNLNDIDRKKLEADTRKDIKKLQSNYLLDGNKDKYYANLAWLLEPFDQTTRNGMMMSVFKQSADGRSELDKTAHKMQMQQIRTGFVQPEGSHQADLMRAITPKEGNE